MIFANADIDGSAIKNCLEVVFAAPCFFFGASSCKNCPRRCPKKAQEPRGTLFSDGSPQTGFKAQNTKNVDLLRCFQ